jgi:two-component system response regulator RegX3
MSRAYKLLIVEDEEPLLRAIVDEFESKGFEVDYSWNGSEGLKKALTNTYDLILLDLMLPGANGFEICQQVKAQKPDCVVVFLTAKSSQEDLIHGLELGADDYITKPFSLKALVLKVSAILRRVGVHFREDERFVIGDAILIDCLNRIGRHLKSDQTPDQTQPPISFTQREVEILQHLKQEAHRPVSRSELLHEVWGYRRGGLQTRTVDIHIAKLRKKIEANPKVPQILITLRGSGYRLMLGLPASEEDSYEVAAGA